MEATTKPRRWTYEEFARLPTSGSTRYEVIAGELVVTPGPWMRHQRIVGKLYQTLVAFVEAERLGEVFLGPLDILFGVGDYLEPDLTFVRRDHAHLLAERGIEGAPDLVVEVLSPSTAKRDRGVKLERYRVYGVPEYWVVDPEARTIEVWQLAEGASEPIVVGSADTLRWTPTSGGPTMEVRVADLFAAAWPEERSKGG